MPKFSLYNTENFYDEYFETDLKPRACSKELVERIDTLNSAELKEKQEAAEHAFYNMGITFVTGDASGLERIFPFDIMPRIISFQEWQILEKGLKQRMKALNLFLADVYSEQKILKDKIIPRHLVETGKSFLKDCIGMKPPKNIWAHINGTDLVRDKDGKFYVLEDNLRCPSGVSYVLENRRVMKRTFPQVFEAMKVMHVDDYPTKLLNTLEHVSPRKYGETSAVLLTPGIHNSAYFEHSFLAQQMGIQVVEGRDLIVVEDFVYMNTTDGLQRVDVIYRRIDDSFLDPEVFNPDSMLGVPGLMRAYTHGNVALVNAPGTGIADDKVIYKFVPEMIKYYLGEEAILANVPTYLCSNDQERKYILANLENLVVKSANEAGGYGMLIGPASTKQEREKFAEQINFNPRNYLAQPVLSLSRVPTMIGSEFQGRHVDLRPYILYAEDIYVMPGGLTRVALKQGSLVVNSSQGGGCKDTWVRTS